LGETRRHCCPGSSKVQETGSLVSRENPETLLSRLLQGSGDRLTVPLRKPGETAVQAPPGFRRPAHRSLEKTQRHCCPGSSRVQETGTPFHRENPGTLLPRLLQGSGDRLAVSLRKPRDTAVQAPPGFRRPAHRSLVKTQKTQKTQRYCCPG
jgi:hypothetical protein